MQLHITFTAVSFLLFVSFLVPCQIQAYVLPKEGLGRSLMCARGAAV